LDSTTQRVKNCNTENDIPCGNWRWGSTE